MRLSRFLLIAVIAATVLCSCGPRRGVVQVKIVSSAGIHGRIYADDPVTGQRREGSAARLAAFLKDLRGSSDNVVYIDAGDFMSGSAETFHDRSAVFEKTDLCALALNTLGCDATVPGDMDFVTGGQQLFDFYSGCNAAVLCANMGFENYGDYLPPYVTLVEHGVRISVIGLTCSPMSGYIPQDIIPDMAFCDPVEAAAHWMPVIMEKENPDVIVGVLHDGSASRLALEVPGFDLIIDGTSGQNSTVVTPQGDTVHIVSPLPDLNGVSLASVTVDFTGNEPLVGISAETASLLQLEPDAGFEAELSSRRNLLDAWLDSTLGTLGTDIDCIGSCWRPSTGAGIVHKYQMRHHAAQISIAAASAPGLYMESGEFKARDAFRLFPDEVNMVSVNMRGSEVISILEYSADRHFNTVGSSADRLLKSDAAAAGTGMLSAAGIDYTIDITKPYGQRISVISMSDGGKFDPDKEYRTTMPSNLFCPELSPLSGVPGLDIAGLQRRLNTSARADMRYHLISDMFVISENRASLTVTGNGNWRLVPEGLAARCLARDTLAIYNSNR